MKAASSFAIVVAKLPLWLTKCPETFLQRFGKIYSLMFISAKSMAREMPIIPSARLVTTRGKDDLASSSSG